jgi:hypothetical protein
MHGKVFNDLILSFRTLVSQAEHYCFSHIKTGRFKTKKEKDKQKSKNFFLKKNGFVYCPSIKWAVPSGQ